MSGRGITLHPSTCRLMEVTDRRGEAKRLFMLAGLHRGQSKMQTWPRSCCRLFADCGFVRDGGSTGKRVFRIGGAIVLTQITTYGTP